MGFLDRGEGAPRPLAVTRVAGDGEAEPVDLLAEPGVRRGRDGAPGRRERAARFVVAQVDAVGVGEQKAPPGGLERLRLGDRHQLLEQRRGARAVAAPMPFDRPARPLLRIVACEHALVGRHGEAVLVQLHADPAE